MSDTFPRYAVGIVHGIDETYQVDWINPDLAYLTVAGDIAAEFCSRTEGGFISTNDLMDQAGDVIADWDSEL